LTCDKKVKARSGLFFGRMIWWDVIAAHLSGTVDRPATVETIATRYLHFVDVYLEARRATYVE
jgi:myo-inositol catabolism protein IolC